MFKGQRFVADLLPTGKIKWEGSEKLFNSPSAWAIHCKKLVNPTKKSGCGWASVSMSVLLVSTVLDQTRVLIFSSL